MRTYPKPRYAKPLPSVGWWLRNLLTIALVHAGVLLTAYFLILLGDALFSAYAILLRDAIFVNYVVRQGWLQTMSAEIKGAIAFVVAVSAVLQTLLLLWRALVD